MEPKIGEIFEYNGEWYQCVKADPIIGADGIINYCERCAISASECDNFNCIDDERSDKELVIFKKLQKLGDPFTVVGKLYQYYKVFDIDNVCGDGSWCVYNYKAKTLTIEIKQNKEDMEEKKLTYEELLHYYHSTVGLWAIDRNPQEVDFDWICKNAFQLGMDKNLSNSENIGKNLKPFDLEAAKAGKPVCTRDGRKARIICFDAKGDYPIVALIETENGEKVGQYMIDGHCTDIISQCCDDLMMLPEKKEGWVNVSKFSTYASKEEALSHKTYDIIETIKVSWEE